MTKFSDEAADYDLAYRRETAAAWCFGTGDEDVWLPKSQCEVDSRGELAPGRVYAVTVPNRLAEEKGLC